MDELDELLKLAGLRVDDAEARRCLSTLLQYARSQSQPSDRPLSVDHNDQLAKIKRTANLLKKQLEMLRVEPSVWGAFWIFPGFEMNGEELPDTGDSFCKFPEFKATGQELPDVFAMLTLVGLAAEAGTIEAKGRPREARKQNIVNFARAFYERFVGSATETLTGGFATFARAFYLHATGEDPESIDRQIRSSVRSARAQKAPKKSALSSVK